MKMITSRGNWEVWDAVLSRCSGVCGGEVTDRRLLPPPHEFERDLAGGRHSLLLSCEVDGEVIVNPPQS